MSDKPVAAGKSSFDLIDPAAFFSHIVIPPSAQILDVACGSGRYSLELAKFLDENGSIHAVDLWDEGIENLKNAIREKGIRNIHPLRADITQKISLGNASIDFCLMATILHDLSPAEQDVALKEVARMIKADGILAVIEFKKIDRGPGPPLGIRISEAELEEKMKKYGFLVTWQGDIGEFNYLLVLRRGREQGRCN